MLMSKDKGNDYQLKKLMIVKQILLISALVNVQRTVWRIWTLMLRYKGLILYLPEVINM